MTRIRASSLADLKFQQNDNPPTRAQKLELIRLALIALEGHTHEEELTFDDTNSYRIPGYFVETPTGNYTLHLHSVTNDIAFLEDFAGSQAHCGIPPAAGFVIEIYREPTFTGLEITGGELLGTLTYDIDGSVTWETENNLRKQMLVGEQLGLKAPAIADAAAALASFTLYAEIGYILNLLLFSGDQTDGDDIVMLSGDQQSGSDFVLLSGEEQYG